MPAINFNGEAEWLALREEHVGGSEIAALFYIWRPFVGDGDVVRHMFEPIPDGHHVVGCLSPYTTGYRLFMEKSGRVAPDFESNERMEAGKHFEPAIARWAGEKWAWKLRNVRRYLRHDYVPRWGASLDFETYKREPVEIKNVDTSVFRSEWIVDGDDLVPPMFINLQLQHEIGVTDAKSGWLVACVGGNKLLRGSVPRHEPSQIKIGDAVTCFWHGVETKAVPSLYADLDTVAAVRFDGDSNLPAVDLRGDAKADALVEEILSTQGRIDSLSAALGIAKGRLAEMLGASTRARLSGHRVTWPVVRREARLVPSRWQEASTFRGALKITTEK